MFRKAPSDKGKNENAFYLRLFNGGMPQNFDTQNHQYSMQFTSLWHRQAIVTVFVFSQLRHSQRACIQFEQDAANERINKKKFLERSRIIARRNSWVIETKAVQLFEFELFVCGNSKVLFIFCKFSTIGLFSFDLNTIEFNFSFCMNVILEMIQVALIYISEFLRNSNSNAIFIQSRKWIHWKVSHINWLSPFYPEATWANWN